MKVGTKIKQFRELKNFTQEYMATALDMSISGYSHIERDQVSITLEKLDKIATILEVSIEEILNFHQGKIFNFGGIKDSENIIGNVERLYNANEDLLNKLVSKYEQEISYLKDELQSLKNLLATILDK